MSASCTYPDCGRHENAAQHGPAETCLGGEPCEYPLEHHAFTTEEQPEPLPEFSVRYLAELVAGRRLTEEEWEAVETHHNCWYSSLEPVLFYLNDALLDAGVVEPD